MIALDRWGIQRRLQAGVGLVGLREGLDGDVEERIGADADLLEESMDAAGRGALVALEAGGASLLGGAGVAPWASSRFAAAGACEGSVTTCAASKWSVKVGSVEPRPEPSTAVEAA